MEEIFKITDRISVLRDGQYRGTLNTAETNEEEVTQLMIGRTLDLSRNESTHELGEVALEVRGLSCGGLFEDVSFRSAGAKSSGSTASSAPDARKSPRRFSACVNPPPGRSTSLGKRSAFIRLRTRSSGASRWCRRIVRARG